MKAAAARRPTSLIAHLKFRTWKSIIKDEI
jgi:hypothetical protein